MEKHFNTTGPVELHQHYAIDPMKRLDWEDVQVLIQRGNYFVLHAPRQTGKTSTLLSMMEALNREGKYKALYVDIEPAQAARLDAEKGMETICHIIASRASDYDIEPGLSDLVRTILNKANPLSAVNELLSVWAKMSDKPIVLMLDEVDTLVGDTLISLLRQLRTGYMQRPKAFPLSIILCGVRDVRDYRIQTSDKEIVLGGSAFNIKAESLRMGSFDQAEIRSLYDQHTAETGQVFAEEIFAELWQDTRGQPWLVNALGNEMIWKDKSARDRSVPITLERYQMARESLIRSRATHLDQLAHQLRDSRVHQVVAAMLAGKSTIPDLREDDLQYVEDLGLIRTRPQVVISNRIYQEILPREITWQWQASITTHQQAWYITPENRLDMPKLLAAFQQFYRENSDIWLQGLPYKEAGPHLVLQAFLQRIVNGGGRIQREYALGRKYTDLLIEWPVNREEGFYGEVQRIVLELKILYTNLEKTIQEGMVQVATYAEQIGTDEIHLLVFNRDASVSWEAKIYQEVRQQGERSVCVWGC